MLSKFQKLFQLAWIFFLFPQMGFATIELEEKVKQNFSSMMEQFQEVQAVEEDYKKSFDTYFRLLKRQESKSSLQTAFENIQTKEKEYLKKLGQYQKRHMRPLVDQYSWAIPNEKALAMIARYSPIIELGAGGGYWASLLVGKEYGNVDIVAYDNNSWANHGSHGVTRWFNVKYGDEAVLLKEENSKRSLLLCWPSMDDFAANALKNFSGEYLIYVGEMPRDTGEFEPSMANQKFFQILDHTFEEVESEVIPNWPGYLDKVYVFKRKPYKGCFSQILEKGTDIVKYLTEADDCKTE